MKNIYLLLATLLLTPTAWAMQGQKEAPIVINTIEDLSGIRNGLSRSYVLARNLDFAAAESYASGVVNEAYRPNHADPTQATNAGFAPIGDTLAAFTGLLNGKGFAVRNLYVRASGHAGLFGVTGDWVLIQNLGIADAFVVSTESHAGGLAGAGGKFGRITSCYATGAVSGEIAGGLIGHIEDKIRIASSYATNEVSGEIVGGLIGRSGDNSRIVRSYATGEVRGEIVGGLVGHAGGDGGVITDAYATGAVHGEIVGGLVGRNGDNSRIVRSYATGAVHGEVVGGLVGHAVGDDDVIADAYATGAVHGETAGGLLGISEGGNSRVSRCYATGAVHGETAGGLVGSATGRDIRLANSYSTGEVNGETAGGLLGIAGVRDTKLYSCYAIGAVSGAVAGGLVGSIESRKQLTLTRLYWDVQTTGVTLAVGRYADSDAPKGRPTGLDTAALQALTPSVTRWSIEIWNFGTTTDYPTLQAASSKE